MTDPEIMEIVEFSSGKLRDPLRTNNSPDQEEMLARLAVHLLSDLGAEVILGCDEGIYIVAGILADHDRKSDGTVEYQVSDGPPGRRSHSNDFYTLREALRFFNNVVAAGGWKAYYEQQRVK